MIDGCIPYNEVTILQKFSEEDIFALAGLPVVTGKLTNPLRDDNRPGCSFKREEHNGRSILFFCDPTGFMGKNCITCVDAVRIAHKLDNNVQAVEYILKHGKNSENVVLPVRRIKPSIRIRTRKWNKSDELVKYFSPEILIKERVYPVTKYWINEGSGFVKNSLGEPTNLVAFVFNPRIKLYFMGRKENKWYANVNEKDIWGDYFVGDTLIITKSCKDYLTLKYICGFEAIGMQSETVRLPQLPGYNRVIILFDNDETGIRESLKDTEEYGYEHRTILLPYKDPYEVLQNKGPDFTKRYFQDLCEIY